MQFLSHSFLLIRLSRLQLLSCLGTPPPGHFSLHLQSAMGKRAQIADHLRTGLVWRPQRQHLVQRSDACKRGREERKTRACACTDAS